MSLRTIGYINGHPIRVDEGPTTPLPAKGFAGSLVTGAHGSVEMGRIQSRAGNLRAKALREPKKVTV